MKKTRDYLSKKCINPWLKFLSIFCIAAVTLFIIFEVNTQRINGNYFNNILKEKADDSILVAATGVDMKSSVAVQFETCQNFIVVDESSGTYEYFSNNQSLNNVQTVRDFIRKKNIETVIAGTMEIGTYQMLHSSQVEVYTGVTGTVGDALKKNKKHELISFRRYYNRRRNTSINNTGIQKSLKKR